MDKGKGEQQIKGIRKISTFITADALLAAVLMVWAQLWIQPSVRLWARWFGKIQTEEVSEALHTFDVNVGWGLIITYLAVFLALLALIWVVYSTLRTHNAHNDKVPAPAIGLFTASVTMAIIDVGQSIYSIARKVLSGSSIWEPLSVSVWLLYVFFGLFVVLAAISGFYAYKISK